MDSATEESDSRTAAFSRKRKQPQSLQTAQYACDSNGKRIKYNSLDGDEYGQNSSNGSRGESTTSASSIRRGSKESATTTEAHEINDEVPKDAHQSGWTPINDGTCYDPFANSNHNGREHESDGESVDREPKPRDTGKEDPILKKLRLREYISNEDYCSMARWLEHNDHSLRLHDIQKPKLKSKVQSLLQANSQEEDGGVAKALESLSKGSDYSSVVRTFLKERYGTVRSTFTGIDGYEMPVGESIEQKLLNAVRLSMEDYDYMAKWLSTNCAGPKIHNIEDPGLHGRIRRLMHDTGIDENAKIAGVLAQATRRSNKGDYHKEARLYLQECYESALRSLDNQDSAQRGLNVENVRPHPALSQLRPPDPGPLAVMKELETSNSGLIHLEDMTTNQNLMKKVVRLAKTQPHKSFEEILREIFVRKTDHYRQAVSFLRNFYQSSKMNGPRPSILERPEPADVPLQELHKTMLKAKGFLRPMTSTDLMNLRPRIRDQVVAHMSKEPSLSFADVLLQITTEDVSGGILAKQRLAEFIAINYVGGNRNTSIHSRQGLADFKHPHSSAATQDGISDWSYSDIILKLKAHGTAALSLDELESMLPDPTEVRKKGIVAEHAHNLKYIKNIWQHPDEPFNHLVAHKLVQLLKDGKAPPGSRLPLEWFVEAVYDINVQNAAEMEQYPEPGSPRKQRSVKEQHSKGQSATPDTKGVIDLTSDPNDYSDTLAELEKTISNTKAYWRPMNEKDLGTDEAFAEQALQLTRDLKLRLEDALLHLAISTSHGQTARTVLTEYIDSCHRPASVGTASDYGEMARQAAASDKGTRRADGESTNGPRPNSVRLQDIGSIELYALQQRYFNHPDPQSLARCLCCGKEGHMEDSCPARTCHHCGTIDDHFSGACPTHQKCGRCRQRGHTTATCTTLLSSIALGQSLCDICGRLDHIEEECSELWHSGLDDDEVINLIPRQEMLMSCYNCGASSSLGLRYAHWGDDCPNFSLYDRSTKSLHRTFSKKYADKFIESPFSNQRRPSTEARGSVPSYQLAMLAD